MTRTTRKLRVVHTTKYTYDRPVERSVHKLHLCPMYDWGQRVLSHALTIDTQAPSVELEDISGNWVTCFEITAP